MCESGLHSSRHPFDALRYAPGFILCRVECDGIIIEEDDKLVCSMRRIVQRMDAREGILYFARMQALSVSHLWNIPDIVLDFLMTGNNAAAAANAAAANTTDATDAANAATYAAYAAVAAAYAAVVTYDARTEWRDMVYDAFGIKE